MATVLRYLVGTWAYPCNYDHIVFNLRDCDSKPSGYCSLFSSLQQTLLHIPFIILSLLFLPCALFPSLIPSYLQASPERCCFVRLFRAPLHSSNQQRPFDVTRPVGSANAWARFTLVILPLHTANLSLFVNRLSVIQSPWRSELFVQPASLQALD